MLGKENKKMSISNDDAKKALKVLFNYGSEKANKGLKLAKDKLAEAKAKRAQKSQNKAKKEDFSLNDATLDDLIKNALKGTYEDDYSNDPVRSADEGDSDLNAPVNSQLPSNANEVPSLDDLAGSADLRDIEPNAKNDLGIIFVKDELITSTLRRLNAYLLVHPDALMSALVFNFNLHDQQYLSPQFYNAVQPSVAPNVRVVIYTLRLLDNSVTLIEALDEREHKAYAVDNRVLLKLKDFVFDSKNSVSLDAEDLFALLKKYPLDQDSREFTVAEENDDEDD